MYKKMITEIEQLIKDQSGAGVSLPIIGGILLIIVGFATLFIGNYIIYAIASSLPAITGTYATDYDNTTASIMTYVSTVVPLFGLVMMMLGFGLILVTLRSGLGAGEAR